MNVGSSPSPASQSFTASIDITRTALEMQQTLSGPDGDLQRTLLVDAVEVNIQIDGAFANRVLQDSTEQQMNAAFAAAGMDTMVESLLQNGMDFSPGATAERIVDFSTIFYSSYQRNHGEQDGQTQMAGFAEMIKGAIEEGFASAQDILAGLGEIAPDVQAGIDETFRLTMQGIDRFVEQQTQQFGVQREAEDPTSVV